MPSLVGPQGKLVVGSPRFNGHTVQFGLGRDWRPNDQWVLRNCEFIKPLGAIGPVGRLIPTDMTYGDWSIDDRGNHSFRIVRASGNPVADYIEFYDGSIYAWGEEDEAQGSLLSVASSWSPRWVLSLVRWSPPPTQGVRPYIAVQMDSSVWQGGAWVDGNVSIVLPLESVYGDYNAPFIHTIRDDEWSGSYDYLYDGRILSTGPRSSAARQGPVREMWAMEYEEDATRYIGSHLLLRNLLDPKGDYWYYRLREARINTGSLRIAIQGQLCAFNLSPVVYGTDKDGDALTMKTRPRYAKGMPLLYDSGLGANAWTDDPVWGSLATVPEDWFVNVADYSNAHWPVVTFYMGVYGDTTQRPILWLVTEQNDAFIANPSIATETTDSADPSGPRLTRLTWSWDWRYRGSKGTATFRPDATGATPWESWRSNSYVEVWAGWQNAEGIAGAALESRKIATGYLMPSTGRSRDGAVQSGAPQLKGVEIGAFDVARLPQKRIIDLRQAGGMTVSDWLSMVGNRMGLPATLIDCDAAVADIVIPTVDLPSTPSLAPQDGDQWTQHLDAVEKAANIRVGFGKTADGALFADAGPPAYEDGVSTIDFELDYDTTTVEDRVYAIDHTASGEDFRNLLKIVVDSDSEEPQIYYWAEFEATRAAGIGDTWEQVETVDEANGESIGDVARAFDREHYSWQDEIEWVGPYRPTLRPDGFLKIVECPNIGLTVGHVYQFTEVRMSLDASSMPLGGKTTIRAKLVYPTDEGPYG